MPPPPRGDAYNLGVLIAFAIERVAALIITRPAIKLLRTPGVELPGGIYRFAIVAAMTTLIAQAAIFFLIRSAGPLLSTLLPHPTLPAILFRDAILSLIGASSYVFLFIALSLLAAQREPDPTTVEVSS